MNRLIKLLFFALVARVLIFLVIGLDLGHLKRLPRSGPAIIVANHNSHLDTLVLMSLFPLSTIHNVRPLADEHYFLNQNRLLAWFSRHVIDIIPVTRTEASEPKIETACSHRQFLKACQRALDRGQILIVYPEGSRGTPEQLTEFRSGIAHLAKRHPEVPIVPVFLQGLGKVLPKGEGLLVPLICRVVIGTPLAWAGCKQRFMDNLAERLIALSTEIYRPEWNDLAVL